MWLSLPLTFALNRNLNINLTRNFNRNRTLLDTSRRTPPKYLSGYTKSRRLVATLPTRKNQIALVGENE